MGRRSQFQKCEKRPQKMGDIVFELSRSGGVRESIGYIPELRGRDYDFELGSGDVRVDNQLLLFG